MFTINMEMIEKVIREFPNRLHPENVGQVKKLATHHMQKGITFPSGSEAAAHVRTIIWNSGYLS